MSVSYLQNYLGEGHGVGGVAGLPQALHCELPFALSFLLGHSKRSRIAGDSGVRGAVTAGSWS